jgi:putative DNA primase/helicase
MKQTIITPDLIRAALAHVPASLARDEWARVGMAIKSEFPDATGQDLFEAWSATADGHDPRATRSTWRSIKAGGGVGIGTLLHLAKEHGFVLPKASEAPAAPSPEVLAQRERERVQRLQAEQARQQAAHAAAAADAVAQWDAASDTGASPYLARKGVQAHGVRFAPDGCVLVPLRDAAGALWNLQRIAPERPADGTDKLFLKGGRKSGLWHWCGDPAGADVLLIAEGWATAASLHQATGRPVAVAFDAGNLAHVAKALRQQCRAALLVLCGDDDRDTEARTGTNTGRVKAEAAARTVRGLAVFPEGLPDGGSDFNDMHQAQGLQAVGACVEAAIAAHQAEQAERAQQAPQSPKQGSGTTRTQREPHGADGSHGEPPDDGRAFDPFTVNDSGVWHAGVDKEGQPKAPQWVCSRLDVQALTRDQDGAGWGYLLAFADPLGKPKQWAMPARMLSGDGGEYRAALLNMGLRIAPSPAARNLLTQYIQTRQPGEFASCTDRIGWHGRAFVLPHETIGDDAERIVFQSESQMENTFRVKHDAAAWRDRIGALCVGNSRLVFAVACAFAGPLLRPAGMESGGFHIRGDSSSGKTTALRLAASVYGGPSYMQRWRTTDNALEAIAAQHCDSLLILDELAQVEGKVAGECAYMLANEQSKARATRNGAPRARLSWRLLFLSAGELGLADHMAEGMKRTRTGQEVRMADIPADAGKGLGAFENLHDFAGGAAFSSHLTREAQACHGAPGRAFIEWACANADTLAKRLRTAVQALARDWIPAGASGQVERVGARFALVGAAGELATEAGLTGWPAGESERGARACFDAWLAARGGAGNGEVVAMLRAVRRFLETHGDGRFAMWHRAADDHAPKTLQRAGVRRMLNADGQPIKSDPEHQREYGERMPAMLGEGVSFEYFVLAETFKAEICQGFDHLAVCRVLEAHGCLIVKEPERYSVSTRLPGIGKVRCYQIPPAIFDLDL